MDRNPLLTFLRGLLLSLFLLGGPGLPLVDALVWHGLATEHPMGPGVAETGVVVHADVCALGSPLPVPGPPACRPSSLALHLPFELSSPAIAHDLPLIKAPATSARPRAPPVLSA